MLVDRVTRLRAEATARMVDRCQLVADAAGTADDTYNEDTLTLTPGPGDPEVLWPPVGQEGPCLINYRAVGRGEEEPGAALGYSIALPFDIAPMPKVGQWINITAAALDPGVAGATFRIENVERGSLAPYVRLHATMISERERAPGG